MIRRVVLIAAMAALVAGLTACTPTTPIPTPSPAAITGTWRHGSDTLTINADGTFSLRDVPRGVIEQAPLALGGGPSGPSEAVSGTWAIGNGGTDVGGAPGVQLTFVMPRKIGFDYGLTLVVSQDDPPQLYVFLGRPDSDIKYSFTKR